LILLYCCNYSPSAGKYTVSILRVMGLAAMGSLFMLVALLYALSRKPKATATHA
jgi:protein SCO1/2